MPLIIDINTLYIFDGETSHGHVIDAIVSKRVDHAEAKAALDIAWIAKHEVIAEKSRAIEARDIAIADHLEVIEGEKSRVAAAEAAVVNERALRAQSV